MGVDQNREQRLSELQERLRQAPMVTSELISTVIAQACLRLQSHARMARILRLVEVGATTDAALAMVELELPQRKLRRLVHDDGLWHCSLSKQLALPGNLDDTADGSHESLPLAIVTAFLEAQRDAGLSTERSQSVPRIRPVLEIAVCCDSFS
jgi:hypothetical protein